MEFWARIIPKIVSGIMSIVDATNLRNRVYEIQNEHEVMWTALDDIARMYKDHPSGEFARKSLKQITRRYGRD